MAQRTGDTTYQYDDDRGSKAQAGAYNMEHTLAYLMVVVALALGAMGVLRGFGIVGDGEPTAVTQNAPGATEGTTQEVAGAGDNANPLADGFVWMLPAIAAAMLANCLHRNEHHKRATNSNMESDKKFGAEHGMAYLVAAGSIAAGTLALLVGFDVFDRGNVQQDGWLWGLAAIGTAILANTLHAVGHHQTATDEEYIVRMIDQRVTSGGSTMGTGTTTVREPRIERGR